MLSPIFLNNPTRCDECLGTNPWCTQCVKNKLEKNFINWTSGDVETDNFVQEKQLKYRNIIFEWIPYDQLGSIEEIDEGGFTEAIWKDGLLQHDYDHRKWIRISNLTVGLKFLSHNLRDTIIMV
jgi:hypothetical protein